MDVKCSSCKSFKNKEEFMKKNKQLKTCFACREKTRKCAKQRIIDDEIFKRICIEEHKRKLETITEDKIKETPPPAVVEFPEQQQILPTADLQYEEDLFFGRII